eukprot:12788518-Prorocentrum_lima.AAC.1
MLESEYESKLQDERRKMRISYERQLEVLRDRRVVAEAATGSPDSGEITGAGGAVSIGRLAADPAASTTAATS